MRNKFKLGKLGLCAFFFLNAATGFAYPEMVRHGYTNCNTCHMSPNGGGVLTQYGRVISEDLLSTWREEGEGGVLFGTVQPPDWLNIGGDVRALQFYRETFASQDARFILMQADAELGVSVGRVDAVGTAGYQDVPTPGVANHFISRRHYLTYHPAEAVSVRAGKFMPAFGINFPDHSAIAKQELGFDQGGETYNLEAAYAGEKWDLFGTAIFGRPDNPTLQRNHGFALRSSANLAETYKLGMSYYFGDNGNDNRHVFGPYGILGFAHSVFATVEWDLQNLHSGATGDTQFGWVDYFRLNYEFIQGATVYVSQELSQLDFNNLDSFIQVYGAGLQFFPRPHFEF